MQEKQIMLSWTGQLGGKQQLEVGGQAGFHE